MSKLTAYCWADGTIEFTEGPCPENALPIANSEDHKALRDAVDVMATHGYNPDHLIVGSVRTAGVFGKDPVDAVIEFGNNVRKILER